MPTAVAAWSGRKAIGSRLSGDFAGQHSLSARRRQAFLLKGRRSLGLCLSGAIIIITPL